MKIKTIITTLLTSAALFTFSGSAFASDVDILIEKLVEKKILTQSEATDIVKEIKKEDKKSSEKSSSSWAEKVKLKGDVRLRYQHEDKEADSNPSRDRYRVRARVGIVAKPADKWEAGIGAASGGSDPRSTNETLDNTFETSDLRLDYAYAKYSPTKDISIVGGKFKNTIWSTKDLLWDGDINPEGISANFNFKINDNFKVFVTPGYYILDEYKTSKGDPSLMFVQPGIDLKAGSVGIKFAATYYNFRDVQGNDFSEDTAGLYGAGSNTVNEDGNLVYDYDAIALDAEIGFKMPEQFGVVEYAKVFGQYVDSDAENENTGILYGFKFGSKKLKKIDSWEVKVNYRKLEKDAWVDFLPDSDFYGGATDVKGMEYELKLGLTKNLSFGLDYYHSKPILGNTDVKQDILQGDLVLKF